MTKTYYDEFMSEPERQKIYEEEALSLEASELISRVMEEKNITRAALAKLLGVSKARVTYLLSGNNMTLRSLAQMAFVLGVQIQVQAEPLKKRRKSHG